MSTITPTTAQSYTQAYVNSAAPLNAIPEAIIVEADQLDALNKIARQYTNIKTYRVYFGKDEAGKAVSVIVGVNADGTDMSIPIYCTTRATDNLCPPMCDAASPIMPTE